MLERTEQIKITMTLNKARTEKYKEELKIILDNTPPYMVDGDCLNLSYFFTINYYNIVSKLKAIRTLLQDEELWVGLKYEELVYGESMLIEMVNEIRQIQNILKPEKVSWIGNLLMYFRPKAKTSSSSIRE